MDAYSTTVCERVETGHPTTLFYALSSGFSGLRWRKPMINYFVYVFLRKKISSDRLGEEVF
jgi:hypothetical protein